MDLALRAEVEEFSQIVAGNVDPGTGEPFASVDDVLRTVITYNLARPNEKFLGYVDGAYRFQSRIEAPVLLSEDAAVHRAGRAVTETAGRALRQRRGRGPLPRGAGRRWRATRDPRGHSSSPTSPTRSARRRRHRALMLLRRRGHGCSPPAGAWLVAGRILRPVRDVADDRPAASPTPTCPAASRSTGRGDELGDLARTVNAMLDRVESGVAAQRRFLDDAGHELRTPITIVRGHLEVLDPADPDDVRETVALVDDELERMNRLVSDLLLLARAEQPAFLRPQPVDVAVLTDDVFGKVRRLGDRDWVLETAARVDALLDPQRITQALVALADNAVRHTGPGTRIAVGSQLAGGELRFWVADGGPGIAPADRARVFERFARGAAGARRSEGAGLGLSIVRAIAAAHGGRVLLDSVPGAAPRSARLPARLAAPATDVLAWTTTPAPWTTQTTPDVPVDRARPETVDEPHPDRRGRAAHRRVHREGAARQRLRDHRGRPTAGRLDSRRGTGGFDLMVLDIGLPGHGRLRGAARAARRAARRSR